MARKRDPRRDEAMEIYKKHDGKIDLIKIADQLDLSAGTVRGWKSKDKWEQQLNGTLQSDQTERSKRRGAPKGNQNALGNKGNCNASPPPRNKNALKHGAYETIYMDLLSDDEKNLLDVMSDDPLLILQEEIRTMRVRQLRMMKRVRAAEAGLTENEKSILHQITAEKQTFEREGKVVSIAIPSDDLKVTEKREKITPKIEWILKIESELTKITGQLTRAVKQMNDIELTQKRVTLLDAQTKKINLELGITNDGPDELPVEDKLELAAKFMERFGVTDDE
ncbi:phage terminase small subunit [Enterococcus sp. LJL128]